MNLFLSKAMQSLFSYDQYEYTVCLSLNHLQYQKAWAFFTKQNQHEATDLLKAYKESDIACWIRL